MSIIINAIEVEIEKKRPYSSATLIGLFSMKVPSEVGWGFVVTAANVTLPSDCWCLIIWFSPRKLIECSSASTLTAFTGAAAFNDATALLVLDIFKL